MAKLAYQLKQELPASTTNQNFVDVIRAAWYTLQIPAFAFPASMVGAIVARPTRAYERFYPDACRHARLSDSAEAFWEQLRPGVVHQESRAFASAAREVLAAELGGDARYETWRLLRHTSLLAFDTAIEGSRDRALAVEALRRMVPDGTSAAAHRLFIYMREIATSLRQTGGSVDRTHVAERLLGMGAVLGEAHDVGQDVVRLARASNEVLRRIRRDVAGIAIGRAELVTAAHDRLEMSRALLLVGEPGVGKSVIMRALAEEQTTHGRVVALDGATLPSVPGWTGLAALLGVQHGLDELVMVLAGSGPLLIAIDGLDRIETPPSRAVVVDLLNACRTLPATSDGQPRWLFLGSMRSEAIGRVQGWLGPYVGVAEAFPVPTLSDEELRGLADAVPSLRGLLLRPDLPEVVRTPLMLQVLAEGEPSGLDAARPLSETDVLRRWWDAVVGPARVRQDALLLLGEHSLATWSTWLPIGVAPPETLQSLERDGVLLRESDGDRYQWGHDRFGDWVIARVCARLGENMFSWLRGQGDPYWVEAGLALFVAGQVEKEHGERRWRRLRELAASAGGRWTSTVERAPLRAGQLIRVLELLEPQLVEDDAALLRTLLRTARTAATQPNAAASAALSQVGAAGEVDEGHRAAVLAEWSTPLWHIWFPLLAWLCPRLERLPARVRGEAAGVAIMWLRSTVTGMPYRAQLGHAALEWLEAMRIPDGQLTYRDEGGEAYLDDLRTAAVQASAELGADVRRLLDALRDLYNRRELAEWLKQAWSVPLQDAAPELFVDFALDIFVPEWRGGPDANLRKLQRQFSSPVDREEMDFEFTQAFLHPSHESGPFLTLLRQQPVQGLRLVRTIVDVATRNRRSANGERMIEVPLELPSGSHTFVGDVQVYAWYRPIGNAPYPIQAALMALEVWMEDQVEQGRDPAELFDTVLEDAESLSLVGVCVGVVVAYPERCLQASAPFIMSPALWEFDIRRMATDRRSLPMFSTMFGGRADPSELAARARDRRPQRHEDLRSLVPRMLFSRDVPGELRERVVRAIQQFPEDRSLLPPAERDKPEAIAWVEGHLRDFAPLGDPVNYRLVEYANGATAIEFEPPPELAAKHTEAKAKLAEMNRTLRLQGWAEAVLGDEEPPWSLDPIEVLREAQPRLPEGETQAELMSDEAVPNEGQVALLAVEALLYRHIAELQRTGQLDWCRERVVNFAMTVPLSDTLRYQVGVARLVAATVKSLSAVLLETESSPAVRLAWWRLCKVSEDHVEKALTLSARRLWYREPALAQGFVIRAVTLARMPRAHWFARGDDVPLGLIEARARLQRIDEALEVAVREGTSIGLSQTEWRADDGATMDGFEDGAAPSFYLPMALSAVPREMFHGAPEGLVWQRVLLSAMRASLAGDQSGKQDRSAGDFRWWGFLGDLLAVLDRDEPARPFVDEALSVCRAAWPRSAPIVREFQLKRAAHTVDQTPPSSDALARWRDLAFWVLPSEPISGERWRSPQSEVWEAYAALLPIGWGGLVLAPRLWPPAGLGEVYERWPSLLAHDHTGFRFYLRFLTESGGGLSAPSVVRSLADAARRATDRDRLWRDRGTATTTSAVLRNLWSRDEVGIRASSVAIADLVWLLDELIRVGNPLAAQMRDQI